VVADEAALRGASFGVKFKLCYLKAYKKYI